MNICRALSVLLVMVACGALSLSTDGEIRIVWRALVTSSDDPATEVQDALADQASLYADPGREIQRAALPSHDDGRPHATDSAVTGARAAWAAGPSRAPPSA